MKFYIEATTVAGATGYKPVEIHITKFVNQQPYFKDDIKNTILENLYLNIDETK